MTKVALVVPNPSVDVVVNAPPLNLGYLASYLRAYGKDVEVKIFDGVIKPEIQKEVISFCPDVVGVTCTTPLAYDALDLLGSLRLSLPDVKTVVGGVHPSAVPEEFVDHCDVVLVGEGEKALLDLVNGVDLSKVFYGKPIMDLDLIPSPAYDLMDMEKYFAAKDGPAFSYPYGLDVARTAPIISSRGCSFRCIFCRNSKRREPVRFHSAGRVVDEILFFVEKYGVNSVFFLDDAFTANRKRIYEFGRLIKEHGLNVPWGCQAKTPNLSYDYLCYLKSINCRFVSPGFENGNPRMLNLLKKGCVTVEQNHEAILNAERADVKIGGSFIFGSPGERKFEMEDTMRFIEDHPQLCFIGINILIPYPGTEAFDICVENGLLPEKVDYRKLVPTSIADRTYIVNNSEGREAYSSYLMDIQRRAWLIGKTNFFVQMYDVPLFKFFKLMRTKSFWIVALKYPRLFSRLMFRIIKGGKTKK